ncbi:MAG: NUDIX hydrolase [Magnetococcales bacterium]|nr:NUDIX hydrolase [Magnetococcales bacterium]MBF0156900.1 NUDIX hydrolase [Magnetococcales bacterium]
MRKPETPYLAADVIIELVDRPGRPVVLVERKNPPPGWAIPGGFVDRGETLENAAVREAREETCLEVRLKALLGVYSDPRRDPRQHTVTPVFIGEAVGEPKAADDASKVAIVEAGRWPEPLAFDHAQILADYLVFRESGRPRPVGDPPRQPPIASVAERGRAMTDYLVLRESTSPKPEDSGQKEAI